MKKRTAFCSVDRPARRSRRGNPRCETHASQPRLGRPERRAVRHYEFQRLDFVACMSMIVGTSGPPGICHFTYFVHLTPASQTDVSTLLRVYGDSFGGHQERPRHRNLHYLLLARFAGFRNRADSVVRLDRKAKRLFITRLKRSLSGDFPVSAGRAQSPHRLARDPRRRSPAPCSFAADASYIREPHAKHPPALAGA